MKNQRLRLNCVKTSTGLAAFITLAHANAQTQLGLSIEIKGAQPQLNVSGPVGTVCQLQWNDNITVTNAWSNLGTLVLTSSSVSLTDSFTSSSHRYYRTVWTPTTNLVWISPGSFIMGSPTNEALRGSDETQHVVVIRHGFWMSKYLVTQAEYLSTLGVNPSNFQPPKYPVDLSRPVETVSWNDATNYCVQRTQKERVAGLIPGTYTYRLPTESEWEYARRAGTATAFYFGSRIHSGDANFYGKCEYDATIGEISNPGGIALNMTSPVGAYAPSPWGLYDMIGNVWEWCQDRYGAYPAGPVIDPQGAPSGSYRVARGGAWHGLGQECRAAIRLSGDGSAANLLVGFRVVLVQGR